MIFLSVNRHYYHHSNFTNKKIEANKINKQALAQGPTVGKWQSLDSDADNLTPNFLFLLFSIKTITSSFFFFSFSMVLEN